MSRCTVRDNLRVYAVGPAGGNGRDNVLVLCPRCAEAVEGRRVADRQAVSLSEGGIGDALRRAGARCECGSTSGCHTTAAASGEDSPGPRYRGHARMSREQSADPPRTEVRARRPRLWCRCGM